VFRGFSTSIGLYLFPLAGISWYYERHRSDKYQESNRVTRTSWVSQRCVITLSAHRAFRGEERRRQFESSRRLSSNISPVIGVM